MAMPAFACPRSNWFDLLVNLARAGLEWGAPGVAQPLQQAVQAAGFGPDPGRLAWELVIRSLHQALTTLLQDEPDPFLAEILDGRGVDLALRGYLETPISALDFRLLSATRRWPGLETITLALLKYMGADRIEPPGMQTAPSRIARQLPEQFCFEMHQEFFSHKDHYRPLVEFFGSETSGSIISGVRWFEYQQSQLQDLHDTISSRWINTHCWTPVYGTTGAQDALGNESVVDVWDEVVAWSSSTSRRNDAIRIVVGPSGSGLTAFGLRIAARLYHAVECRAFLVECSQTDRLSNWDDVACSQQQADPDLQREPNLASPESGDVLRLIIIDNLSPDLGQNDFAEALRKLKSRNRGGRVHVRLLLLLHDSMEDVCRAALPQPGAVLRLCPWDLGGNARPDLIRDRRQSWWQFYVGDPWPAVLDQPPLRDMTIWPGALKEVAQLYKQDPEQFPSTPGRVVEHLIGGQQGPANGCTAKEALTLIALGLCQTGGVASRDKLIDYLSNSGALPNNLTATTLVDWAIPPRSFVRSAPPNGLPELTSPALQDYLCAMAMIDAIQALVGTSADEQRLPLWIARFGRTPITPAILAALQDCLSLYNRTDVASWQEPLIASLITALDWSEWRGLAPCGPDIDPRALAANVSESLLAAANACARVSGINNNPGWDLARPTLFRDWLVCIQGLRRADDSVLRRILSHLNFNGQEGLALIGLDLSCLNLSGYDLSHGDFSGCDLHLNDLTDTDLTGATLDDTDMRGVRLEQTRLTDATLSPAEWSGAVAIDVCGNWASASEGFADWLERQRPDEPEDLDENVSVEPPRQEPGALSAPGQANPQSP